MAGHSHWANIKRTKGAADAKRGALFSRIAREITMAAKLGGGDPDFNIRLRSAINNAKAENMPSDSIERALKKGTGELAGDAIEEITYEGYAPGGVAIIVETTTDNRNRSASEMRSIFTKAGGNLGGSGSVAWMFHKKAYFFIESNQEDSILEVTLDAGADDVIAVEGGVEVLGKFENFAALDTALRKGGFKVNVAKHIQVSDNMMLVNDLDIARRVINLIEKLDDHDDVQNVFSNHDIPEEILSQIEV